MAALESAIGREAVQFQKHTQPAEVEVTAAGKSALQAWVGFRPATPMVERVTSFAN